MNHYKYVVDGYIIAIGTGARGMGEEITAAEYDEIMTVIHNKPQVTETTDYKLKTDLTWEEYEIEPPEPSEDIDDSEALEILLGGAE